MNKLQQYQELVQKRKQHQFQHSLTNPAETAYDVDHIEPWAQWHHHLEPDLLIVGQEFCDVTTFDQCKGKVELKAGIYEYPANQNLADYLAMIGYDPGHPLDPNPAVKLFFTNAVMGLKPGSMSSNFQDKWLKESRELFLAPLIQLLQPKGIICIGSKATKSVLKVFGHRFSSLKQQVAASPIQTENILLFPVYHTGGLGLANRSKVEQKKDWENIGGHLNN